MKSDREDRTEDAAAEIALAAFFDEESEGAERAEYERRLSERDLDLRRHLNQFEAARKGMKRFLAEECKGRKVDVWEAIAPEIEKTAERYRAEHQAAAEAESKRAQRNNKGISIWGGFFRPPIQPVAAFAAGMAVMLAVIASQKADQRGPISGADRLQARESVVVSPRFVGSGDGKNSGQIVVSRETPVVGAFGRPDAGTLLGQQVTLPGPRIANSSMGSDLTSQLTSKEASGEFLNELRASGLDIVWMRSQKRFKVLPMRDRSAPPVIWVARGGE